MRTLLFAASLALPSVAAVAKPSALHVGGWARPTIAGQSGSAAYLTIHNGGRSADRLLAASSPAAASASLHATNTAGGVARMRGAGPQLIGPGKALSMQPGGMHIMLSGLKAPLRAGTRLPLTLRFQHAGLVRVSVPVQMSAPDARHAH